MRVTDGQNVLDIIFQEFGRIDELYNEILIPNNISITAELKGGQLLSSNPRGKGNQRNKDFVKQNGLVFMNSAITVNENIQPAPILQWPLPLNVSPGVLINPNKIVDDPA